MDNKDELKLFEYRGLDEDITAHTFGLHVDEDVENQTFGFSLYHKVNGEIRAAKCCVSRNELVLYNADNLVDVITKRAFHSLFGETDEESDITSLAYQFYRSRFSKLLS